ncbi:MAG: hypothetical protein OES79_03065, partial [Planctomycetota bacterium]|nr:hypothetical protein [Planctomycetota bacterium]
EELWQAFVSRHSNFEIVLNGHYKPFEKTGPNPDQVKALRALAAAYRGDTYEDGRIAHQMLFNAQWAPRGGDGWIRLMEFLPDGKTVRVRTFSPYLLRTARDKTKAWRTTIDMQFAIVLSPSLRISTVP